MRTISLLVCLCLPVLGETYSESGLDDANYRAWRRELAQRQWQARQAWYENYISSLREEPVPAAPVVSKVTRISNVRVTACSPQDPQDVEYYRKNGYAGATYNVAADYSQFPKGTYIRVPGYRGGKWHKVDSAGGGVIRRSVRAGQRHIDVKYQTHHSAQRWGSKMLTLDVIFPKDFNGFLP